MMTELGLLGWSIVLGLVQLLVAANYAQRQRGFAWAAGSRDQDPGPLTGVAARLGRAQDNFLQTYGYFVAAVLALASLDAFSILSLIGAQLYFWSRVLYFPLYGLGVRNWRSLVWITSMLGLVLLAASLLLAVLIK